MNCRKRFFCLLAFTLLISVFSLVLLIKGGYVVRIFDLSGGETKQVDLHSMLLNSSWKISAAHGNEELDVLFIGNSITLHPVVDYWWGVWGMAATEREKDYSHILTHLLADHGKVVAKSVNFGQWELLWYDRAETYPLIEPFVAKGTYDIIVVQLCENISNWDTLEKDYIEFLTYLKEKQPQSMVMVVGNFWKSDEVEKAKRKACLQAGVTYVNLEFIQGKISYMLGSGKEVSGDDKKLHLSEHAGVNSHPGNLGMQAIAEEIYREYFNVRRNN